MSNLAMVLRDRVAAAVSRHGGVAPLVGAVWRLARERGPGALVRRAWRAVRGRGEQLPAVPGWEVSAGAAAGAMVEDVAPTSPARWLERAPGVLLVGHPYLISGRGEDVRTAAAALDTQSIPFQLRNTYDGGVENQPKLANFPFFDRLSRDARYRANLFMLNADEMLPARAHLGAELFAGSYNIGCWAWELSQFPDAWLPALEVVDEIWAPSRFIQQAIAERTAKPVIRMPLAVEPQESRLPRAHFGLPDDRFLFLFFFDFSSFVARKNPWAVIEAFERAFPETEREHLGLVIKLNGAQLRPDDYLAFLEHASIRRPGVYLIDQVLSDPEIRGLMQGCDAFVSLHRAEGFGRGPAEAMYFGKPVIVTGYSGNLDFCSDLDCCLVDHTLVPVREGEYPFGKGQLWAEADVDQASWFMRRLVADADYARTIAARGAAAIREFNSAAAVGRRYHARLARLGLI